jgi:hypothetical protein
MFITEEHFTKHTNITTIYNFTLKQKVFTKVIKNARIVAQVDGPIRLLKAMVMRKHLKVRVAEFA